MLTPRALAAPGRNTIVLKTVEVSPRSQSLAVELFEEAGLAAGVLKLISMSRESSSALTAEFKAHQRLGFELYFCDREQSHVSILVYRVGKIIAVEAAKHLKTCILALRGKVQPSYIPDLFLLTFMYFISVP